GLVNTHTHLELTAMRGFLEDLDFADWIDKLRQSRNEILHDAKLLDSAKFGIIEGLEEGITTYADTCSSGVVMQAMVALGVRGIEVSKRARSPIALLEKHEVLEPGSLLIHCVRVDDADITTIARRGCSVAHCPASNAKFGHGVAPLLPMLAAGIPVGIGSDSV